MDFLLITLFVFWLVLGATHAVHILDRYINKELKEITLGEAISSIIFLPQELILLFTYIVMASIEFLFYKLNIKRIFIFLKNVYNIKLFRH